MGLVLGGSISMSSVLPIAGGGTGQATASAALAALLPIQTGNAGKSLMTDGNVASWVIAAGSGTVTSVNATGSNGITVTGGPITASGSIAFSLGDITPSSVLSTGSIAGTNLSGTNTGDQTITLTGDITGSGTGSFATTLATVNSDVGTYGSTTIVPIVTVNAKGLVTAVSTATISGSIAVTGGDLTLSGSTGSNITNATLATVNSNIGTYGSTTTVPVVTVNAKGLVTAVSTATISGSIAVTGGDLTLSGSTGSNITNATLATVNSNVGTYGSTTVVPVVTVNAKGLVTSVTTAAISGAISVTGGDLTLSGTTGSDITNATLATVNLSPVTNAFKKVTVTSKGLVTATSTVAPGDITTALGFTPYNATNPAGYITGVSSSDITTALGFTPYNATNPAGYITGITSSNVTTALGFTPANNAGDTITGTYTFTSGTVTGLATPTAGTDATTKNYVDAAVAGLSWKTSVKAATTANITLSGTQTIDGIALAAGNRVLVKNQTSTPTNGIYVVAAGAWARAADSTTASELDGEAVYVQQGTTQADTGWTETATVVNVGTDPVIYVQFSGSGTYTAGTGLSLTGNTFANTGVTAIIAGTNISVSGATGGVTVNLVSAPTITGTNITGIPNSGLTNSLVTIGSTNLSLGDTATTLSGLTSVSSTSFSGLLLGNASTATILAVPRAINGVNFDGSAPITVSASAGTLTGIALNATVVSSSLTSVGTLTSVNTSGTVNINSIGTVGTATLTTSATTANQVIDALAIASIRSATYNISITSGSSYQYTEIRILQDGSNVYISETNTILSGSSLASFTSDISGGNMRLLTTPVNAVTTYKTVSIQVAV